MVVRLGRIQRPARTWGTGNNPKTALDRFLTENNDFETDRTIENKLLFTSNPGGYLRRRKKREYSYGNAP